jgi:hypothetical protein
MILAGKLSGSNAAVTAFEFQRRVLNQILDGKKQIADACQSLDSKLSGELNNQISNLDSKLNDSIAEMRQM